MAYECAGRSNFGTPTLRIMKCPECGNEMEMFSTEEGKALMRKMGIPEELIQAGLSGIGALALGYPEGEPHPAKPRKENYYRIIK